MTREQAKNNLISFGVENPTEEQITNYLNQVNGEAQKEKERADKLKEKADKADELQTQLDALQSQNLSEVEKAQKENEKLQKQVAELPGLMVLRQKPRLFSKAQIWRMLILKPCFLEWLRELKRLRMRRRGPMSMSLP